MAKTKGRPQGSPNTKTTTAAEPSRCPACGSTSRGPYMGTPIVVEFGGLHEGQPFTHVVRRRCRCAACDQARFDLSHENRTT